MTAREYLKQLKRLDTLIQQKINEQNELQSMSTSIKGVDYSKEKISSNRSTEAPFVNICDKIFQLDQEIQHDIDMYVDQKRKIINQIQQLKNPQHVVVLYKRYVEFKKFKQIAVEMHYTYQYIRLLHGHALKNFEKFQQNSTNIQQNSTTFNIKM